jgi:hypothetical protein
VPVTNENEASMRVVGRSITGAGASGCGFFCEPKGNALVFNVVVDSKFKGRE